MKRELISLLPSLFRKCLKSVLSYRLVGSAAGEFKKIEVALYKFSVILSYAMSCVRHRRGRNYQLQLSGLLLYYTGI